MSTTDPLTLRLPSWLCDSFDLARVIANEHRSPGTKERNLVPQRVRWWNAKPERNSTALVRSQSPLLPVQVTEPVPPKRCEPRHPDAEAWTHLRDCVPRLPLPLPLR